MKYSLIWFLTVMFCVSAIAQTSEKPLPNRTETISYLSKRAQETKGLYSSVIRFENEGYIYKHTVSPADDDKISIWRESGALSSIPGYGDCDISTLRIIDTFRPSQIVDISDAGAGSGGVGFAVIKLSAASSQRSYIRFGFTHVIEPGLPTSGQCSYFGLKSKSSSTAQYVYMAYMNSDPANFGRIKKAFLHLKDLDKGSDPFGE